MTPVEQDNLILRIKASRQVQRSAVDKINSQVGEGIANSKFVGHTSSFAKVNYSKASLQWADYAAPVYRMQRGCYAPPRTVM